MTLRVGIMGAGAIGCYVGGRLAALAGDADNDVVLVMRPALADEIARDGLTLTDLRGFASTTVVSDSRLRVATDARALADRDVVIVTVKSGDTATAARELAPVLSSSCVVVSLQNGVSNPAVLRTHLAGRVQAVLAAMVPFNVLRKDGARFHQGTSGRIAVGQGARAGELATALTRAGMNARVVAEIDAILWGKLLVNLNNSVNALAGVPIAEMIADPLYRKVMAACLREAIDVLAAARVRAVLEPPLPPRLVPALLSLPNALFRVSSRAMIRVDPHARSSMWDDLSRGRTTEVDALNGEIVRLAATVHASAPKNAAIVALVKAAEHRPLSPMSARDLAARVLV